MNGNFLTQRDRENPPIHNENFGLAHHLGQKLDVTFLRKLSFEGSAEIRSENFGLDDGAINEPFSARISLRSGAEIPLQHLLCYTLQNFKAENTRVLWPPINMWRGERDLQTLGT